MGNRAVIHFKDSNVGIYVHVNGGRDSIEPLLQVAKDYKLRSGDYGIARLAQMLGNAFGGTLSLGIDTLDNLDTDNYDNGTYVIDESFNIVDRLYMNGAEQDVLDFRTVYNWIRKANDNQFIYGDPYKGLAN